MPSTITTTVPEPLVAELLSAAARLSVDAVRMHCIARTGSMVSELDEGLATIAARATESLWRLMPSQEFEWLASASCAVQEVVEWACHQAMCCFAGEDRCRGPITWWPQGVTGVSNGDVETVAAQRAELLQQELVHLQREADSVIDAELAA